MPSWIKLDMVSRLIFELIVCGYFFTSGSTLLISWSELGWLTASSAPIRLTHKASYPRPRAPQWQIPLHIRVLLVHFSTLPSPGRTSPMQFSRYVSICNPGEPHLTPLKWILRYLRGTVDFDLLLHHRSSSTELVVYTDADWDPPLHLRLRRLLRRQPGVLVVQAPASRLLLQCRGGVPRCRQRRGWGFLAPAAPRRAPQPSLPKRTNTNDCKTHSFMYLFLETCPWYIIFIQILNRYSQIVPWHSISLMKVVN